jgi:hypothetical protein
MQWHREVVAHLAHLAQAAQPARCVRPPSGEADGEREAAVVDPTDPSRHGACSRDSAMLTLQRAFKYDGDPAQAPCRSAVIQLAVPGYSYVSTIVPRIESLTVGGKLTLVASDGAVVSRSDFAYYDLSLRVQPIAGEDAAAIAERHIDWKAFKDAVDHGALPFSFAGGSPLVRSSGQSARVQIKRFDGSVVWSQELAGEPSAWNALAIEVPLVRPIKLSAARKAPSASPANASVD